MYSDSITSFGIDLSFNVGQVLHIVKGSSLKQFQITSLGDYFVHPVDPKDRSFYV